MPKVPKQESAMEETGTCKVAGLSFESKKHFSIKRKNNPCHQEEVKLIVQARASERDSSRSKPLPQLHSLENT